jgi:hypothetical protein
MGIVFRVINIDAGSPINEVKVRMRLFGVHNNYKHKLTYFPKLSVPVFVEIYN